MEENKENVAEEAKQETTDQVEETPQVDESKFESAGDDSVIKVDLSKPPKPVENEEPKEEAKVEASSTDDGGVVAESESTEPTQEQEEVQPETETQEAVEEKVEEAIAEAEATGNPLPENIQKLVDFMEETGGDLNDYVKLHTNVENMDDSEILHDYYKKTKPHLNNEEINFLLEDKFSYDEENAEEREIKRKKLALKEQVAEAKAYLDGQKSKYYEDIKAGSKLTGEQQEAIDFFNKYNQEEEQNMKTVKLQQDTFLDKTDKVFNNEFKGFEFEVDGEKMVYNVSNVEDVKNSQKDINNFVRKFLNNDSMMDDAVGYHKSLFTAMNPDAVAKHFYEQGKSDAIKQSVAKTKNINTSRESHKVYEGDNGIKFRVLGDDANDMKLRIKTRK